MKMLLLSFLLPLSANASLPVLTCHNGATGADLSLGYYADHTYFLANNVLIDVLERQGARDVERTGGDGASIQHENGGVFFSANLRQGTLTVSREDGGYRVRVMQTRVYANFYFNRGECRE